MPDSSEKTRIIVRTVEFFHWCFVLLLLIQTPLLHSKERPLALIGPVIQQGPIEEAEKQILFNRLKEIMLERFRLVSHKVIEQIRERGYASIDIDQCQSGKCVNTILDFLAELEKRYQSRQYFQLEILRSGSTTMLSIKRSDLRYPEIIQQLETVACENCTLPELNLNLEKASEALLTEFPRILVEERAFPAKTLPEKSLELEGQNLIPEAEVGEEKLLASPPKEVAVEAKIPKPEDEMPAVDSRISPEDDRGQGETSALESSPPPPPPDPYITARVSYNQVIAAQLLDITYSLQVFRIGMHVVLQVEIDEQGTVIGQEVLESSGSRGFDETAMLGIEELELAPLPSPMNEYTSYKVNLRIQNYQ